MSGLAVLRSVRWHLRTVLTFSHRQTISCGEREVTGGFRKKRLSQTLPHSHTFFYYFFGNQRSETWNSVVQFPTGGSQPNCGKLHFFSFFETSPYLSIGLTHAHHLARGRARTEGTGGCRPTLETASSTTRRGNNNFLSGAEVEMMFIRL